MLQWGTVVVAAGKVSEPLWALIEIVCVFDSSENVAAEFSLWSDGNPWAGGWTR